MEFQAKALFWAGSELPIPARNGKPAVTYHVAQFVQRGSRDQLELFVEKDVLDQLVEMQEYVLLVDWQLDPNARRLFKPYLRKVSTVPAVRQVPEQVAPAKVATA